MLRFFLNPVRMFFIARDAPNKKDLPELLYVFVKRLFFNYDT
jgi:hypothetical protein